MASAQFNCLYPALESHRSFPVPVQKYAMIFRNYGDKKKYLYIDRWLNKSGVKKFIYLAESQVNSDCKKEKNIIHTYTLYVKLSSNL